jgi:hypothetical protein
MFGSCRYTYRRLPYVSGVALHPKSCTLIYTGRGLDAIDPSIIPILPFYTAPYQHSMRARLTIDPRLLHGFDHVDLSFGYYSTKALSSA